MKIKKNKSSLFSSKASRIGPKTLRYSVPKPHKLITYILFLFCFWNFIFQIISIIQIYLDDYTHNKTSITWSIASVCTNLFFSLALFFLYDNRKVLKKMLRKNRMDECFFDYILMTGYLCLIISYSINIFFNQKFENPKGNYGMMLSFSNLLIVSGFIFMLTKNFKIRVIFVFILTCFWGTIIFSNDVKDKEYDIQVIKLVLKILCNVSLLIFYMYSSQPQPNRPKPFNKSFQTSPYNTILSPSCKLTEALAYPNENKLYNFLNQIHSAIIIFDEQMELRYYNKEITSFLSCSPQKCNTQGSFSLIDKPAIPIPKFESTRADILERLNEITGIQLFESENQIQEYLDDLRTSFQSFTGESTTKIKDFFTSLSFKKLLSLMKMILKSKQKPLYQLMREKYILFSYFHKNANICRSMEEFHFTSNPTSRLIEIKASIVLFEGAERIMLMFTDATDRKKALELSTINEHKDKLLANVAHEFRTPLNGISAMLELIKMVNEGKNEKMNEYINSACFSVNLLKNYINDILDMALIKNGKFSLHFDSFDIRNLINEISSIINAQAKKKEVVYESFVDPFVPIFIVSDQTRLTQILLNLLSNSIKFTLKNGFIILKVTYEDSVGVKFEVTDTGIGISQENLQLIFRKYGKIQSEINDALNPQGIGLGLVISKLLAEELSPETHKKFQISSHIGKGTSFSFYIANQANPEASISNLSPSSNKFSEGKEENHSENLEIKNKNFKILSQDDILQSHTNVFARSEKKSSNNSFVKLSGSGGKDLFIQRKRSSINMSLFPVVKCLCPRILVVDDDMFNIIVLQEILKILGFESDYAANGNDAIQKVNERNERKCCDRCQPFRLIFMDSVMPFLTGVETTKILKDFDNSNKIRIIGYSGDEDLEKFRIAGADAFLRKPLDRKELSNILNDYKELFV